MSSFNSTNNHQKGTTSLNAYGKPVPNPRECQSNICNSGKRHRIPPCISTTHGAMEVSQVMGVPLVMIHLYMGCSIINHNFLGFSYRFPMVWGTPLKGLILGRHPKSSRRSARWDTGLWDARPLGGRISEWWFKVGYGQQLAWLAPVSIVGLYIYIYIHVYIYIYTYSYM